VVIAGKVQYHLGQQRRRLTPVLKWHEIIKFINAAVLSGARKAILCRTLGKYLQIFTETLYDGPLRRFVMKFKTILLSIRYHG
jgi:hypothetical protein